MTTVWTNENKTSSPTWTGEVTLGQYYFDDPTISFDSASISFDGVVITWTNEIQS